VLAACEKAETVSYSEDVRPILNEHCMECHKVGGKGQVESGMSMESYEALMAGTEYGPMVIPGDSFGSNLVVLIEGRADPSIYMPKGKHGPLSDEQIQTIKTWIDQGAKNN
jgi:hypothetical protein